MSGMEIFGYDESNVLSKYQSRGMCFISLKIACENIECLDTLNTNNSLALVYQRG